MSNIIIEGKNLNDINQSNFQTVGVRSGFHFISSWDSAYDPEQWIILTHQGQSITEKTFIYDTLEGHFTRYGDADGEFFSPELTFLLKNTTIEPWQGRLHYDKKLLASLETQDSTIIDGQWVPFDKDQYFSFVRNASYQQTKYPYFFIGDVYQNNLKWTITDKFKRIPNYLGKGMIPRFDDSEEPKFYFVMDDRFPLGTYTENNKQFWELQTTDPKTGKTQFGRSKMKTAFSDVIVSGSYIGVVTSEEERFSVDALVFTERENKSTPLCFYYDKKLHPEEYNLASNGKVFMKIELRDSGRDTLNNIDLFQERKAFRPFRLGFAKDEQDGGLGDVFGEGLYNGGDSVTLYGTAHDNSYMLGIFDDEGTQLSQGETYTLSMPEEDVAYTARFRKNPKVIITPRYYPIDGDPIEGTENAKGIVHVYASDVYYDNDEAEYYTVPLTGEDEMDYAPLGESKEREDFKPTLHGGSMYTARQKLTSNGWNFSGFTYVSASGVSEETFPELPNVDDGQFPSDVSQHRSFYIQEDFRYPMVNDERTLQIYSNYTTTTFTLTNGNYNFNWEGDTNEDFLNALSYGPFKFGIRRKWGAQLITDQTVEIQLFENNDYGTIVGEGFNSQGNRGTVRLLWDVDITPSESPHGGGVLNEDVVHDGYDGGVFVARASDWMANMGGLNDGDEWELVDIPSTGNILDHGEYWDLDDAIRINNDIPPYPSQITNNDNMFTMQLGKSPAPLPDEPYSMGGDQRVYKVTSVSLASSDSGEYTWDLEWGHNFGTQADPDTASPTYFLNDRFDLSQSEIDDGEKGIQLFGEIPPDNPDGFLKNYNPNDNFGVGSGKTTPIIGGEYHTTIFFKARQMGTYVKSVLQGGIDTIFELTNVGPDEIVRQQADSGVINANMFNFGEEVRFQVTPSEPAEEPMYQMWAYTENGSEFPPDVYKISGTGSPFPELTKAALGVTFDWNEGGNFGTLNYNIPESRDATVEVDDVEYPAWFRYVEFRFTVPQEEDFDGNEGGDEQVDDEFHARLSAIDIPGTGGQIRLEDNTVLGTGNAALDLFPTENGDFSELTVEQRTIRLRAVPTSGIAEGAWSVVADPGVNTNTIGIIDQVSGVGSTDDIIDFTINSTGNITISYNWSGDDSEGGP